MHAPLFHTQSSSLAHASSLSYSMSPPHPHIWWWRSKREEAASTSSPLGGASLQQHLSSGTEGAAGDDVHFASPRRYLSTAFPSPCAVAVAASPSPPCGEIFPFRSLALPSSPGDMWQWQSCPSRLGGGLLNGGKRRRRMKFSTVIISAFFI